MAQRLSKFLASRNQSHIKSKNPRTKRSGFELSWFWPVSTQLSENGVCRNYLLFLVLSLPCERNNPSSPRKLADMAPLVLLTGATGYLGSHVLHELMLRDFSVICTVRKIEQGVFFQNLYPNKCLAFVEVPDLSLDESLTSILKINPVEYVIHLATPYHEDFDIKSCKQSIVDPSRKQFERVVAACCSHGRALKSLIMGSCFAAMVSDPPRFDDPSKTYNTRSTCFISPDQTITSRLSALIAARFFAEEAAWETYYEAPNSSSFSLRLIVTPLLLGPPAHDVALSSLKGPLKQMYSFISSQDKSVLESFPFPFYVDVRDAAETFVNSIRLCESETGRFFICANNISSQYVVDLTSKIMPELKPRLSLGVSGTGEAELEGQCRFNTTDNRELCKFTFRPLEDTLRDTFEALISLEAAQDSENLARALEESFPKPLAEDDENTNSVGGDSVEAQSKDMFLHDASTADNLNSHHLHHSSSES